MKNNKFPLKNALIAVAVILIALFVFKSSSMQTYQGYVMCYMQSFDSCYSRTSQAVSAFVPVDSSGDPTLLEKTGTCEIVFKSQAVDERGFTQTFTGTVDGILVNKGNFVICQGDGEITWIYDATGEILSKPKWNIDYIAGQTYEFFGYFHFESPLCITGETITETCEDGSVIITKECINNEWVETGNECPENGIPIEIIVLLIALVIALVVLIWLVRR